LKVQRLNLQAILVVKLCNRAAKKVMQRKSEIITVSFLKPQVPEQTGNNKG